MTRGAQAPRQGICHVTNSRFESSTQCQGWMTNPASLRRRRIQIFTWVMFTLLAGLFSSDIFNTHGNGYKSMYVVEASPTETDSHANAALSTRGFLFQDNDAPFTLNYNMHVMLLGLNGDGAHRAVLDADAFSQSLSNSLPAGRPYSVVAEEPMHVQYAMTYNVVHGSSDTLLKIEKILADAMEYVPNPENKHISPGWEGNDRVFEIDIQKVEFDLSRLLTSQIGQHITASPSIPAASTAVAASREHIILIISPERQRMREHLAARASRSIRASAAIPKISADQPWGYRYRFGPNGTPCKQWVAAGRFVVVDLSAMQNAYGTTDTAEGSVSATQIPSLDADTLRLEQSTDEDGHAVSVTRPSVAFVAKLTTLALSAVRKVFVSDVMYRRVDYAKKVVVPIVVLRNHDRFDPVAAGTGATGRKGETSDPAYADMKIDVARIREELRHMLLPSQELVVTTITHSVHDHYRLSMSIFKALKASSRHAANEVGKYQVNSIPMLDSDLLLHDVVGAAGTDLLLMSMVSNSNVLDASRATKAQLIADEDHKKAIRRLVARKKKQQKQRRGLKGWQVEKFTGKVSPILDQRILPIFVYSLIGLPEGTLLDGSSLAVASKRGDMVVALQTPQEKVKVPFFSNSQPIHLNARDPTRAIIAAAVTALGGVVPPYAEYDAMNNRLSHDYMWSHGHHPFGPFSASLRVSRVFADAVIRNSIVARVSTAVNNVKKAVHELNEFTKDFVSDPRHDDRFAGKDASQALSTATWYDRLKSGNILSPLAATVAKSLATHLEVLDAHLLSLGPLLENHEWGRATELASALYVSAQAFAATTHSEIEQARDELSCCRKTYIEKAALAGLGSALFDYTTGALKSAFGTVTAGAATATQAISHSANTKGYGGISVLMWVVGAIWLIVSVVVIGVCCMGSKSKPTRKPTTGSQTSTESRIGGSNVLSANEPLLPGGKSFANAPESFGMPQFSPSIPTLPKPIEATSTAAAGSGPYSSSTQPIPTPSSLSSAFGVPTLPTVYTPDATQQMAELKTQQVPSHAQYEAAQSTAAQAALPPLPPSQQQQPFTPSRVGNMQGLMSLGQQQQQQQQQPSTMFVPNALPSPASHAYLPTGAPSSAPQSQLPTPTNAGAGVPFMPQRGPVPSSIPTLPTLPSVPTIPQQQMPAMTPSAMSVPAITPRPAGTVSGLPTPTLSLPTFPNPTMPGQFGASPRAPQVPVQMSPSHGLPQPSPAFSTSRLPQVPSMPPMPTVPTGLPLPSPHAGIPAVPTVPTLPVLPGIPQLPTMPPGTSPGSRSQQQ